ncbi:hypothetical protein [Acutalibacter muris]|jgi:hypothetical protein|uniref:hypothetical protein n=1 Tax=Acutalibacter muris TaxID=1796620 RepID=UPI001C3EA8EF|nr:hypothetical protein [Acutalibacter muris]
MSSAINHRKRSHRSERGKQSTFGASRRAYNSAEYQKKSGPFRSLFQKFKRNTASDRAGKQREARTNDGV